jgi:hypothetical protein
MSNIDKIENNMYDEYCYHDDYFYNKSKYAYGFYTLSYNEKDIYISGFIINNNDYDSINHFKTEILRSHMYHYNEHKLSEVYSKIKNKNNIRINIINYRIIDRELFNYNEIKDKLYYIIKNNYNNLYNKIKDTFNMKDMLNALELDLIDNDLENEDNVFLSTIIKS